MVTKIIKIHFKNEPFLVKKFKTRVDVERWTELHLPVFVSGACLVIALWSAFRGKLMSKADDPKK